MNATEIWIVDDDPNYGPALKIILEDELYGSPVRIFRNCAELFTALDEGSRPMSVVLDMMLPKDKDDQDGGLPPTRGKETSRDTTGTIALRRLIAKGVAPCNIAVITALMDDQYLLPLMELGLAKENILIKPALVEEIVKAVKRVTLKVKKPAG